MKVYAGNDSQAGKRHYLTETIPACPRAAAEAEKVRTRLINQVDEQRNPRTRATVGQLMDRYLDIVDVGSTGSTPCCADAAHCDGRPFVVHAVAGEHECTSKCRPHVCRPLSSASIHKIHFVLPGALSRADPVALDHGQPVRVRRTAPRRDALPSPAYAEQAATILKAAFSIDLGGVSSCGSR